MTDSPLYLLRRRVLRTLGITSLAVSACGGPQDGVTNGEIANRPPGYQEVDPIVALHHAQTCVETPPLAEGVYKGRVCQPFPEDGTPCMPGEAVDANALASSVLGPPDDGMCYRTAYLDCGPVEEQEACCYDLIVQMDCVIEGRPFFVDGELQLAPTTRSSHWTGPIPHIEALPPELREQLAEAWSEVGLHEHASVSAFSRVVMQLMALGAPSTLIEDAVRAMHDEIEHARLAFSLASAFAGHTLSAGPLPADGLVIDCSPERVLWDTLVEGCVCETIAAAQAHAGAEQAREPHARAALEQIAEDESRHALLAWATVRWLLTQHPELHSHAQSALHYAIAGVVQASAPKDAFAAPAFGRLGPHAMQAIAREVVEVIVRPASQGLLGHAPPVQMT